MMLNEVVGRMIIVITIIYIATLLVNVRNVLSASQVVLKQLKNEKHNEEKTADLSQLINETLTVNNKLPYDANQSFQDDWTFDRVEHDLMDFLQELSARYKNSNSSQKSGWSAIDELANRSENSLGSVNITSIANEATSNSLQSATTRKDTIAESSASESSHVTDVQDQSTTRAVKTTNPPIISITQLPVSIATGDHDISESTWQYGIFDRFTRPRASSTTQQPPDSLSISGSGASLDVKTFNSDECGLRAYRQEPDYFPQSSSQLDTDEITKELSQRRQRPPLSSSFFSSHKKYHQTVGGDLSGDPLERDNLAPLPPFDRYGIPSSGSEAMTNTERHRQNYTALLEDVRQSQAAGTEGSSLNLGDSEFNLTARRQWLQQQLGSTLQMLGFNSTNQLASDILINQTNSFNSLGQRENMMKMSSSQINNSNLNKMAKASSEFKPLKSSVDADELSEMKLSGPEITEQELKARQDELKLEARVIGGNDARLGDSPWSVSLQALVSRPGTGGVEYRHYCGGTIIAEYYILTAAHCLDFMVGRESRLFVVVGDLNWRMSTASMYGRRFGIEKLIIHGGYKSTAFGHDIGLIRTKESMKPLKVNGRYIINSVCLPERNMEHSGEAELVGWGLFSNRNEMADSLQIADVPILPRPLCVDLYRRRTGLIQWLIGIELITEKQICAGTFGRGICQGDSGSALVFNEKASLEAKASGYRLKSNLLRDAQQRATIIGVVAFGGIRRCSYQSLPGVYMQTSKYLDWILPRIQATG